MQLHLSPADEGFIQNMIESGAYTNEAELVGEALRRLREQDGKLANALAQGEADMAAGRVTPYNAGFMDDCEKMARDMISCGEKYK